MVIAICSSLCLLNLRAYISLETTTTTAITTATIAEPSTNSTEPSVAEQSTTQLSVDVSIIPKATEGEEIPPTTTTATTSVLSAAQPTQLEDSSAAAAAAETASTPHVSDSNNNIVKIMYISGCGNY